MRKSDVFSRLRAALMPWLLRLGANERGVAAVEFALVLPVMLFLYMGSVEIGTAILVDKRVASAAGAVGDLVARAKSSITTGEIDDYFEASGMIMLPYDDSTLEQIVTSVYVDADGIATVQWSRGYNGGSPYAANSVLDLPDALTDIAPDTYVIVAEASMPYQPTFGVALNALFKTVLGDTLTLYKQFFFLPRFGEEITLS